MPDVYSYTTDPGLAEILSKGAGLFVVSRMQSTPRIAAGAGVVGFVGGVVNDRGVPGVPVVLVNGVDDFFDLYGGFDVDLGDGAAAGYAGNACAVLYGIDARNIVFVPVDLAVKDKTISDATAVDLLVSIAQQFDITGIASSDVIVTDRPHGAAVGDTVVLSDLTGGTGLTAGTYVVATVPSDTQLTLVGVDFSTNITDGTMVLAVQRTLKAGTQIKTSGGGYVLATLEDVSWSTGDAATKTVRVRQVSGTPAALNTVSVFVDSANADCRVVTPAVTVPDAVDDEEIALRYTAAFDVIDSNPAGLSVTALANDRNEAAIDDAMVSQCVASAASGHYMVAVCAPPVGTSAATAEGTTGDGVGRSSLDGSRAVYVHAGWERRFLPDADNLTGPDYLATFPGQAVLASVIAQTPPEENPCRPHAQFAAYGCAKLELALTQSQRETHFRANIASAVFERIAGRLVGSYRDGVMADGTKIARRRLTDMLAGALIEIATPYHKALATPANREALGDAASNYLDGLVQPPGKAAGEGRIAGYAVSVSWDAVNSICTLNVAVQELGNMDAILIRLNVTADEVGVALAA